MRMRASEECPDPMAYLASHPVSQSLATLGFYRLDEKVSGSDLLLPTLQNQPMGYRFQPWAARDSSKTDSHTGELLYRLPSTSSLSF